MFNKKGVVEELRADLQKKFEIHPLDKEWLDKGNVDMLSAFVGLPEKRILERIKGVMDATITDIIFTSEGLDQTRLKQGMVIAFNSILNTIKQWQEYAKKKEK